MSIIFYMVFDSGYKYMYDKYNDVYRFVPLNGDTAGLCAFTDAVADPWFSPAGYNRGSVRVQLNLLITHRKQIVTFSIRLGLTQLLISPARVLHSLVIRLLFQNQVHLTALTCVVCSLFLKKQLPLLLSSNSLSSMMNLQGHSSVIW